MKETKNSEVFLRPRFKVEVLKSKEILLSQFKRELQEKTCSFSSKIAGNHIFLDISKTDSKIWSPQLQLELEEVSANETLVKGLFGPKPHVWTFFMFLHFFIAVIFIGFSIMLYVQKTLGNNITLPFAIVILMPVFWFTLYFLGRYAKVKARKQMISLHNFVEKVVDK